MKTDLETRRLQHVKEKFVIFERKCACCGKFFRFEKMWCVLRGGINHTANEWCYCKECMPTAKDVLHEIDTDGCAFGIAGIDEGTEFKKDKTRMNTAYAPFLSPESSPK